MACLKLWLCKKVNYYGCLIIFEALFIRLSERPENCSNRSYDLGNLPDSAKTQNGKRSIKRKSDIVLFT